MDIFQVVAKVLTFEFSKFGALEWIVLIGGAVVLYFVVAAFYEMKNLG